MRTLIENILGTNECNFRTIHPSQNYYNNHSAHGCSSKSTNISNEKNKSKKRNNKMIVTVMIRKDFKLLPLNYHFQQ